MVVTETEARYRLQVADRFGNPTIGPFTKTTTPQPTTTPFR